MLTLSVLRHKEMYLQKLFMRSLRGLITFSRSHYLPENYFKVPSEQLLLFLLKFK